MMKRAAAAQAGFTLVEMLVALGIFALLAAAGVGILRASVDTQSTVEDHLGQIRDLGRLDALLSSDLAQAVDRPTRTASGERPAFLGQPGHMELVRAGWSNVDSSRRSDLQRVQWQQEGANLTRTGFLHLDGSDEGSASAVLARNISRASFRYRTAAGEWASSFSSTDKEPLPAAVEATVSLPGGDPVVIVVALPEGPHADVPPGQQT